MPVVDVMCQREPRAQWSDIIQWPDLSAESQGIFMTIIIIIISLS